MTINPYYQFEIDTAGQKLAFDVSYVRIENGGLNLLDTEEINIGQPYFAQENNQAGETDFWTGQLDYTYPLSQKVKLQFGGSIRMQF